MYIIIKEGIRCTAKDIENKSTYVGIKYDPTATSKDGRFVYQVVDKQLFFFSVIKYGIKFQEVVKRCSYTNTFDVT